MNILFHYVYWGVSAGPSASISPKGFSGNGVRLNFIKWNGENCNEAVNLFVSSFCIIYSYEYWLLHFTILCVWKKLKHRKTTLLTEFNPENNKQENEMLDINRLCHHTYTVWWFYIFISFHFIVISFFFFFYHCFNVIPLVEFCFIGFFLFSRLSSFFLNNLACN